MLNYSFANTSIQSQSATEMELVNEFCFFLALPNAEAG